MGQAALCGEEKSKSEEGQGASEEDGGGAVGKGHSGRMEEDERDGGWMRTAEGEKSPEYLRRIKVPNGLNWGGNGWMKRNWKEDGGEGRMKESKGCFEGADIVEEKCWPKNQKIGQHLEKMTEEEQ